MMEGVNRGKEEGGGREGYLLIPYICALFLVLYRGCRVRGMAGRELLFYLDSHNVAVMVLDEFSSFFSLCGCMCACACACACVREFVCV